MSRTKENTKNNGCCSLNIQSSMNFTGSSKLNPSLDNRCYPILTEKDDFSDDQYENIFQKVRDAGNSSLDIKLCDVSNCDLYNIEHIIYVDESIKSIDCEDTIHTTSKNPIDRSVDVDDDDTFYNFLLKYSKMYQWVDNDWYEPYPFEIK